MISESKLGRILVATAVIAYALAGVADIAWAFSSRVDVKDALGAACVMLVGGALTLRFGRGKEFMGGPLFKGQSVAMGFASGIWISLVLAAAGAFYPLIGHAHFIPYMGYVGSIAFIPPILASVALIIVDRVRGANKK